MLFFFMFFRSGDFVSVQILIDWCMIFALSSSQSLKALFSEASSMRSKSSGFLILVTLLATFPAWGQMIQSVPTQNAPAQPVTQPAPQSGQKNGGDFSDVTNPDPKKVVPKDTIIVKGAWS